MRASWTTHPHVGEITQLASRYTNPIYYTLTIFTILDKIKIPVELKTYGSVETRAAKAPIKFNFKIAGGWRRSNFND